MTGGGTARSASVAATNNVNTVMITTQTTDVISPRPPISVTSGATPTIGSVRITSA